MKLSEALAESKRIEGEMMRLMAQRDSVVQQEFNLPDGTDVAVAAKLRADFVHHKAEKMIELTGQIKYLMVNLIDYKVRLNKRNVELGIDVKLQQMKLLRLELSKLMGMLKGKRYHDALSQDTIEALDLNNRIKELERDKGKLDAEIQSLNWSNDL